MILFFAYPTKYFLELNSIVNKTLIHRFSEDGDLEAVKSIFIKDKWVILNQIAPIKEKMIRSLKIQQEQSELSMTYFSSNLYKPGKINS